MISEYESLRLTAQNAFDAERSQEERNKLGQFATPSRIANAILKETLKYCPFENIRFLDPGIGTGSFFSALLNNVGPKKIVAAQGYEIDPRLVAFSNKFWQEHGLSVIERDFTTVKHPEKANLVIANPPYVRHHHIAYEDKIRLKTEVLNRLGIDISGLAGLYCYFMLLCDEALENGAISSWLIPSEFLDVNYGSAIKRYLLEKVDLLRIHKFDPTDTQFTDALVSSAIVWFRKTKTTENKTLFTSGALGEPKHRVEVPHTSLFPEEKWTRFFTSADTAHVDEKTILFSNLFKVKRGVATGANDFFVLDESKVGTLQIPQEFLSPILPSPRAVKDNEITGDENGIPKNIKRLFLFSSSLDLEEIKKHSPDTAQYIETGITSKVHARYLCSKRKPWYNQEKRKPPLFFCTYMGRSDGENDRPFRFILNKSCAIATNVYLMLYPTPELNTMIEKDPELIFRIAKFLNSIDARRLVHSGRVYGGGLHKLEPKELSNLRITAHEIGL